MVLLARLSDLWIAVGVVGAFEPSHPLSFLSPPHFLTLLHGMNVLCVESWVSFPFLHCCFPCHFDLTLLGIATDSKWLLATRTRYHDCFHSGYPCYTLLFRIHILYACCKQTFCIGIPSTCILIFFDIALGVELCCTISIDNLLPSIISILSTLASAFTFKDQTSSLDKVSLVISNDVLKRRLYKFATARLLKVDR